MTIYHEEIEEDIEMLNSKDYFQVKGWNGMIICNLLMTSQQMRACKAGHLNEK